MSYLGCPLWSSIKQKDSSRSQNRRILRDWKACPEDLQKSYGGDPEDTNEDER